MKIVPVILGLAIVAAAGVYQAKHAYASSVYQTLVRNGTELKATANGQTIEFRGEAHAVVVTRIPKDGFFGLQPGDRVETLDSSAIRSMDDLNDALDARDHAKAPEVTFEVRRGDIAVTVKVPRKQGYDLLV